MYLSSSLSMYIHIYSHIIHTTYLLLLSLLLVILLFVSDGRCRPRRTCRRSPWPPRPRGREFFFSSSSFKQITTIRTFVYFLLSYLVISIYLQIFISFRYLYIYIYICIYISLSLSLSIYLSFSLSLYVYIYIYRYL